VDDTKAYDLIVIGAGPAGAMGAGTAAQFGKRVALVEKSPELGGAGINTGTIPSKTLRETAVALSGMRARQLYGVDLSLRREATVGDFMYHERRVTQSAREYITSRLQQEHVDTYCGTARFVDPHTVTLTPGPGSKQEPARLRGEVILIASGSSPARPPQFPFEHPRVHDSNEILELQELPKSLAVVGAGVIGSEYACTFTALGTQVHLIDGRDRLLPFLDTEIAETLTRAMEDSGIVFHWKEKVDVCEAPEQGDVVLRLSSGKVLNVGGVLVAAGRSSNTEELDLAAAGIAPGERGLISVDQYYCTTVPHIYAAGDVIGFPALASTSMEQARLAVCHAFCLDYQFEIAPLLPAGIYTIPEVSMVGETEQTLQQRKIPYVVGRAAYCQSARGKIIGDDIGLLKLIFRRDGMQLLGVHVLGEQATELVHVGLMVLLSGAGIEVFERACFNFPTLGTLYKTATYDALVQAAEPAA
jgi:NAD(P) transhydrogenase